MKVSSAHTSLLLSFLPLAFCNDPQVLLDYGTSPSLMAVEDPNPKYVVAHFIVGNTYPYVVEDWYKAIILASSKGIDAFALDVGQDYWQPARVADAFTAAQNASTDTDGYLNTFKLFMSFDMSSLPCASPSDATILQSYINTYQSHPNQLMYNGRVLVSTFAGEGCRFGQSGLNEGWRYALKGAGLPDIHFIPSFFANPAEFGELDILDGVFNWNSAWPIGNSNISIDSDIAYLNNLGGRTYMAGVSPWFFTHYGSDTYNKNFIYRGDDWLFATRWELLFENRQSIDFVQVISWNDFGESHYVGPITGAQPKSEVWTTGFDHQGWLDLIQYYAAAFKLGVYPEILRDRVFAWARLYPANASAPDHIGKPQNSAFTEDYLWAVVLLTSPAKVKLSCGASEEISNLPAGMSKMRLLLLEDCSVGVRMWKNEVQVLEFFPKGFAFNRNPPSYNFNAFVASY